MPDTSNPRPGRLIIPGADAEPEAAPTPKIVTPTGGSHHDVREDR